MSLSAEAAIAIEIGFLAITTVFLFLRLYVRLCLQRKGVTASDSSIVAAYVCFAYLVAADIVCWRYGVWDEENQFALDGQLGRMETVATREKLTVAFKLIFAAGIAQYLSLWCVKFAFLILYYQMLSPVLHNLRMALHVTTIFTIVGWIVMMAMNVFWCYPVERNWTLDSTQVCWSWPDNTVYFTTLGFHLVTDLMIYTWPFALLHALRLELSKRKMWGVGAMFGLGFISILSSVARAVSVGMSFWVTVSGAWSAAELGTAIMVACCPPLRWLYHFRSLRPHPSSEDLALVERTLPQPSKMGDFESQKNPGRDMSIYELEGKD